MKSSRFIGVPVAAFFLGVMPLASQAQPAERPARPPVGGDSWGPVHVIDTATHPISIAS